MSRRVVPSNAVAGALAEGGPVVALETSVLAQGLPPPHNRRAAERMDAAIRREGAEPAWTWIAAGAVRVGAEDADLDALMGGDAAKVARRDLPMAVAGGGPGATTVSATLWAARRVGIEISATGGIGGVHPGGQDVSADLLELAVAGGALVCSGPKSIIDPAATLERLEELGVSVIGYGTDRLPHFLTESTDLPLDHRADDPGEVAAIVAAHRELETPSTLLVCNPIPSAAALDTETVARAVAACSDEAKDMSGKALTPFLLSCIAERTGGRSTEANVALLEANASLAAAIAVRLASARHGTVI